MLQVILRHRYEPVELKILRSLNVRMNLSDKDKLSYHKLEKGFKGELAFDERLQELSCNCMILNDLLLEANNTIFQIDSLLFTAEKVYLFEVKNYEGDYYVQDNKWYTINHKKINNPVLQLERSDTLFQQVMHDSKFNLPLESYLIFIHPEFNLYQSPLNSPIIFPTQLNRFMGKLTFHSKKLSPHHKNIANKLLSLQLKDSPYKRFPTYEHKDLVKGIICRSCLAFTNHINGIIMCHNCGHSEKVDTAILRSIDEYKLLFPDKKVTTSAIHDWCKIIKCEKKIRRTLLKHYTIVGSRRHSYYVSSCLAKTN